MSCTALALALMVPLAVMCGTAGYAGGVASVPVNIDCGSADIASSMSEYAAVTSCLTNAANNCSFAHATVTSNSIYSPTTTKFYVNGCSGDRVLMDVIIESGGSGVRASCRIPKSALQNFGPQSAMGSYCQRS